MAWREQFECRVPKSNNRYITLVAADDTSFHIVDVELPTSVIVLTAARKIRANISPYSTAVAALVDRISL
ncbi:hypothetical protein [Sphingopyxis sp.]|jgi:hypothetical protein|uniref:hypothetical protein n=1 Tax=Sphingopyxis sp. TaxID=1908224 RepID=UPI003F6F1504